MYGGSTHAVKDQILCYARRLGSRIGYNITISVRFNEDHCLHTSTTCSNFLLCAPTPLFVPNISVSWSSHGVWGFFKQWVHMKKMLWTVCLRDLSTMVTSEVDCRCNKIRFVWTSICSCYKVLNHVPIYHTARYLQDSVSLPRNTVHPCIT